MRAHTVILGAGATIATIPNGDKHGRKSSVMNGLIEKLNMQDMFANIELQTNSDNLEDIYAELHSRPECCDIVIELEKRLYDYFAELELPDNPTIYDLLILSLTDKDVIATFNWDPLLIQAYNRVNKITSNLPELLFLHGCVAVGLCESCKCFGPLVNKFCPKCGQEYIMPKLLFPVKNKNYNQNLFIQEQWQVFDYYLENAGIVTIWGYSAPNSDIEAKERMLKVFSNSFRKLDQIEIIDIEEHELLTNKWKSFAKQTNFHLQIFSSLLDTLIAEFPRRSIDGYTKRFIEGWWGKSTLTLKECKTFEELKVLFLPLLIKERDNNFDII